jgi:hypothetical protein
MPEPQVSADAVVRGTPQVFRAPAQLRWTLFVCLVLLAVLATSVILALPPVSSLGFGAMSALLCVGLVTAALARLIVTECIAAFRVRIEVGPQSVALRLPARRGHVVRPALATTVPYDAIDRIESREEAFHQLGLIAIQTAYRIVLRDGRSIELGADRQLRAPLFGPAAQAVAGRGNLRLHEGGMVDGHAGLLAVSRTSVPAWGAPALPSAAARQRRDRSERATENIGTFEMLMTIVQLILRR